MDQFDPFETTWSNLNQLELFWANLNQLDPIWANLDQFDPTRTNLDQSADAKHGRYSLEGHKFSESSCNLPVTAGAHFLVEAGEDGGGEEDGEEQTYS